MRNDRLRTELLLAAVVSSVLVLAVWAAIGPAAAHGVAAASIVLTSIVFHRRLRGAVAVSPSAGAMRRAAIMPFVVGVAALVVLGIVIEAVIWLRSPPRGPSGGIGSVSAGVSEALVETVLGLCLVCLLAAGARAIFGGRGRSGRKPQ
jgi:hypothetical protein